MLKGWKSGEGGENGMHVLHRAAWVVPVASPPIPNGAVLARGDTILAVGDYRTIAAQAPAGARRIDHEDRALFPALVNAHTHLELSTFEGVIPFPQEGFAAWIKELLPRRRSMPPGAEVQGLAKGKLQLARSGVACCGDIANQVDLPEQVTNPLPTRHIFLEVLGFNENELASVLDPHVMSIIQEAVLGGGGFSVAAHACYSTSAALIRQSKEWCRRHRAPFTMHVAEHSDEMEFLSSGTGFCRELLEALGRWDSRWTPPRMSPVRYLKELDVLDGETLLVHTVHMTEQDWETVAEYHCSVCFCPRSNRNLSEGRPDVEKPLKLGITTALGTDSLASNSDLNLFSEAAYVLDHYPGIDPRAVVSMITLGGAKALQQDDRFGSIEPGKTSSFLAVTIPHSLHGSTLMENIVRQGKEGAWQWANSPMND